MRNRFRAGSPVLRTMAATGETEILIYGDIGESWWDEDGGITAKNVKAKVDDVPVGHDIVVRINSPGGDAFEGVAIGNILSSSEHRVVVKVDGTAISAASIIAMAGDEIRMADNALMMIHDPWTFSMGNAEEMRATADKLDKVAGALAQTYVSRTGKPKDEVLGLMAAETWMDAEEALEAGFATHIDGASDDAEALLTEHKIAAYGNVPGSVSRWMRQPYPEIAAACAVADKALERRRARVAEKADPCVGVVVPKLSPPAVERGGSTPTQESTVELQEVQAALNKANEKIAQLTEDVSVANTRADTFETQNIALAKERDAFGERLNALDATRIEAKVKAFVGVKFAANEYDDQLESAMTNESLFDKLTAQRTGMTLLNHDPVDAGADPVTKRAGANGSGEGLTKVVNAAAAAKE